MTKKFNKTTNTALDAMKSVRKEMPPPKRIEKTKKEKAKEKDKKAGRKDWRNYTESKKEK